MGGGNRIVEVEDLRLAYGTKEVLHGISFGIDANEIFAVIGPAQSGKTSLLRCINRTIEFTAGASVQSAKTDSSLIEFLRELRRIRDEAVPQAELVPDGRAQPEVQAVEGVCWGLANRVLSGLAQLGQDSVNRFIYRRWPA